MRQRGHAFTVSGFVGWRRAGTSLLAAMITAALPGTMRAQRGGPAPATPRAGAPIDLTGYWVSVVTEDWRYRMLTPAKGDYIGIPISATGKKAADAWDQAKDEAAGNQCKAYGAPGLMNLPTHLHITWQDDNTLRVDTDYGTQTRMLHFGGWRPPEPRKRSWQGNSVAVWASRSGGRGGRPSARYLRITTTDLLAGYLRKNGVPYGENASLVEYVDLFKEPNGAALSVWTAVVDDPVNLETPYIVSSQFKRQPDMSGWDPSPCSAGW